MTEHDVILEVIELIDQGVLQDRSKTPLRPRVTLVGSGQKKRLAETEGAYEDRRRVVDVGRFVRELRQKHPYAELVVSDKSVAERTAIEMAGLLEMPCRVIEAGAKDEWDSGVAILNERCVAAASHVIAFDETSRSQEYKRLARQQYKVFSQV